MYGVGILVLLQNAYKIFQTTQKEIVCMYVLFNVVIQQQTAGQGKPTSHPVFYMLIRTHEVQC